MATFSVVANCIYSTTTADLTAAATTIVVTDATGFPATEPYYLTIWDVVAHPDPADDTGREIVQVTGRVGTSLTVVRGQDDTGAATHNAGDRIALLLVVALIDEWTTAINAHAHAAGDGGIIDHGGLGGLVDDDHAQYHTDGRAVIWLAANHEVTYDHADIALNTTHRSSDGSDHTFIDQAVTATASPTFAKIRVNDKVFFTQADEDEFIDSLDDGYMDYGATTAHRFNNNVNVIGGGLRIGTATDMLAPLGITGDATSIEDRHEGIWIRGKTGAYIVQINVRGSRLEIGGGAPLDTTPAMSVNYLTGEVGIGTTTPSYILDVDAGEIGEGNYNGLRIVDTGWKATSHPMLEFYNSHASFGGGGTLARIYGEIGNVGTNSKLYFAVADSSKNLQDRMVIDKDGNVGIGETDPNALLEVNGDLQVNDKVVFTQDDKNEFIDSLNSGYMDYGATTAHRFNNNVVLPKTSGKGIKVDTTTPTFGWRDLQAEPSGINTGASKPSQAIYRDDLKQFQFAENDEEYFEFHIPHDYVAGTDVHIHIHWSHTGQYVNGGTVTFTVESSYVKGHNQASFPASVSGDFTGTASTQYKHIVSETQLSASSPAGLQIDTDDLEPDGIIIMRVLLKTNGMTVSEGTVPDPFIHHVDVHYQSTNIATKAKVPDFYT